MWPGLAYLAGLSLLFGAAIYALLCRIDPMGDEAPDDGGSGIVTSPKSFAATEPGRARIGLKVVTMTEGYSRELL